MQRIETSEVPQSLQRLRQRQPHLRTREAAQQLGLSELELLGAFCGKGVLRLRNGGRDVLPELAGLGRVMALTRNPHAVIEKVGRFAPVEISAHNGLVLGEAIDLRLFLHHWVHAIAVVDGSATGTGMSLQFYDAAGTAVHKVFLTADSDQAAFRELVTRHLDAQQEAMQALQPPIVAAAANPDAEIDVEGLRRAWAAMQDTHDVFGVQQRFGVTRLQALRLLGDDWVRPVDAVSLRTALEAAALRGTAVMVFIGNHGAVQIHTGPVHRTQVQGAWFNVLDDDFNLHLYEPAIAAAWVVRKPTADGTVTSLELFAQDGDMIGQLFGKRKPGVPEDPHWRSLIESMPAAQA